MRSSIIRGGYTVLEDGTVYSPNGRKLKQQPRADGYSYYHVDGSLVGVHRMLAEAFIPNPENKRTVNHINGVKSHNSIDNLEWATHSENLKHAYDNGLAVRAKGDKSYQSKLSAEEAEKIRSEYPDRYIGWGRETCRRYGISEVTLYKLVGNKTYPVVEH